MNKSMIALLAGVCWCIGTPAIAQEKVAAEPTVEASKTVDANTENPIPRLAELRIDEFTVPARMINLPIPGRTRTVQDILEQFDDWAEDEKVGGLLMDVGSLRLPLSDISELRAAILRMKGSGKKVYSFVNAGGPNAYLLASAAHEIAVAPNGSVMIPGLGNAYPFMKGHFQMRGMEYDVITAGRYKYPGFMNRREPDQYFLEEFGAILDSLYHDYKSMIMEGRNLSEDEVVSAIDTALHSASEAQQRGLVDTIAYYDDFRDRILKKQRLRRDRSQRQGLAAVNSIQDLMEMINESLREAEESRQAVGPKIAVLHARGPIVDMNMGAAFSSSMICRDDFAKVVDQLRRNKSIKAVVMRVDSPGGSGYASDVIWQKLRRLDEEKPLIVSMGSVAGSGGYYIACPARRIFAQPTTITGSIGVLSILQNAWSMYNRMDYEFAELSRGKRSLMGAPHRTLDPEDRTFLQKYMNDFYDVFIERVAVTRRLPASEVRKVAEGRIWSGRDALEIGLVDELGGMEEAIETARTMANIPPSAELRIVHYPRPSSLGEIFDSFSGVGIQQALAALSAGQNQAVPVSFEQQLQIFSSRFMPLCWMGIPGLGASTTSPEGFQARQLDDALSTWLDSVNPLPH